MNPRIAHVGLRTKDVAGAKEFYGRVFGRPIQGIFELPGIAAARGAPSHWLGFVKVTVEQHARALETLLSRGATQLGPAVERSATVILRDPGGAVIAISRGVEWPAEPVSWHHLHTADAVQAAQNYADAFGWSPTASAASESVGFLRQFAWDVGGPNVGSISDTAGRPELHSHWTFYFEVSDIDGASTEVVASGGKLLGWGSPRAGARIVACEDPQGAEFGLLGRDS